jgi:hypothetical protein
VRPEAVVNIPALFRRGELDPPVVFNTPLSLQDIKTNLRARERDWRESAIPAELREIGIRKLELNEDDDELTIHWGGKTNPVNNPVCVITVVRRPDGGSDVTARFGRGKLQIMPLILLLLTPLQAIGRAGSPLRWYFVAATLAISFAFFVTGSSNTLILKSHLLKVVEETIRSSYKPPSSRFSRMIPTDDGF